MSRVDISIHLYRLVLVEGGTVSLLATRVTENVTPMMIEGTECIYVIDVYKMN